MDTRRRRRRGGSIALWTWASGPRACPPTVELGPDLRSQIEQRARRATAPTNESAADGGVTVASLQADLANAKAHNSRLRQQLRALEQRFSEALGRDIAEQLEPPAERRDELRRELQDAQAQVFELQEQLADAREELDAVREINRELLAQHNRPVH